MDRWLYASRVVRGRPSDLERVLQSDLEELLVDTAERHSDGSITTAVGARIIGRQVMKSVRLRVGVAYRRLGSLHIPVRWTADPLPRAFPSFEGYIEVEAMSAMSAQLTLVGKYRPPLGPVGAAADALGMHEVATNTGNALLDRVVSALELRLRTSSSPAHVPESARTRDASRGVMRVRDVMTPDPIVLNPDMPMRTAAKLLLHFGISGAPVVSGDGELLGVLSESDLLDKEAAGPARGLDPAERRRRSAITVGQACTRPALTTHPDIVLHDAARDMIDDDVSRLVVIKNAKIVGMITRHDILKALTRSDAELQVVIADVLAARDLDVDVNVEWGVAIVGGHAPTRSLAEYAVATITDVDGVVGSDTDGLTWEHDDVELPVALL